MSIKGREQVGEFIPDNLIAGNRHPVDVCMVWIQAGQNLKRGTLLEAAAAAAGVSEPDEDEEDTADTGEHPQMRKPSISLRTMWTRQKRTLRQRYIGRENLPRTRSSSRKDTPFPIRTGKS